MVGVLLASDPDLKDDALLFLLYHLDNIFDRFIQDEVSMELL